MKLLDFHAGWCFPCQQQEPIIDDLEEEHRDADWLDIERVDVDEEPMRASEFGVRSIPTLILVDSDEQVMKEWTGLTQGDELREVIDSHSP